MGMQIGAILSRKIWQYRMKLNTRSPLNPATPLQGIYPEPRPPTMWKCICKTFFIEAAAAAAKSLQSCQTLCNPIDGSPPGSAVPGILQANMLSRLVIAFPPRSKHLLISWLQSPSAVILEPQKNKVSHCFHCLPIYLPGSDGTGCDDLSFLNGFPLPPPMHESEKWKWSSSVMSNS